MRARVLQHHRDPAVQVGDQQHPRGAGTNLGDAADQTAFNTAVFTANHAILALDDAIQASIDVGSSDAGAPTLTAAIGAVAAAVANVVAIVTNFQALVAVPTAGTAAVADLSAHARSLTALTVPAK